MVVFLVANEIINKYDVEISKDSLGCNRWPKIRLLTPYNP
jgi:hypothetical protein